MYRAEPGRKKTGKQYTSADEVKENYLSDENPEAAQKVHRELRQLHLPGLPQHRDAFENLV